MNLQFIPPTELAQSYCVHTLVHMSYHHPRGPKDSEALLRQDDAFDYLPRGSRHHFGVIALKITCHECRETLWVKE